MSLRSRRQRDSPGQAKLNEVKLGAALGYIKEKNYERA
jgi:hypothetical protein